jgi:hypothetical protein
MDSSAMHKGAEGNTRLAWEIFAEIAWWSTTLRSTEAAETRAISDLDTTEMESHIPMHSIKIGKSRAVTAIDLQRMNFCNNPLGMPKIVCF